MPSQRVLYINWAPLWMGTELGGGVNGYQQRIAVEMARRGHEVFSLSSGWEYSLAPGIHLKRGPDFEGVANYIIVNSPTLAPSSFNHEDPRGDVEEPRSESLFQRVLDDLRPDVVHFHNLEGLSAGCVRLARRAGSRVVCSLHNYHGLCSQVYLLYREREICQDFQGGERCRTCVTDVPPKLAEKRLRRARRLAEAAGAGPGMRDAYKELFQLLKAVGYSVRAVPTAVASLLDGWRSRVRSVLDLPVRPTMDRVIVRQEPRAAAADYAFRRERMLEALGGADLVLAVSNAARGIFVKMGLKADSIRVCPIGTAIASQAPLSRRLPFPSAPTDPVRVAFLGLASPPKGLPFLLSALTGLEGELLSRVHLRVFARGVESCNAALARLEPWLGGLETRDGYAYEEIPLLLRDVDLGIVPPVWWDNAPQVVFEMLAMGVPVLGADIGGIPDFVRTGVNGILFEPGDRGDLLEKLGTLLANPEVLLKLAQGILPLKTIPAHVDELEAFYRSDEADTSPGSRLP